MSEVTNKIIGSKAIISFENNTIFKIAMLTLEMYCRLHFQFCRTNESVKYFVYSVVIM
jgi:hypothetical protein